VTRLSLVQPTLALPRLVPPISLRRRASNRVGEDWSVSHLPSEPCASASATGRAQGGRA
jgi:hypothetical protein